MRLPYVGFYDTVSSCFIIRPKKSWSVGFPCRNPARVAQPQCACHTPNSRAGSVLQHRVPHDGCVENGCLHLKPARHQELNRRFCKVFKEGLEVYFTRLTLVIRGVGRFCGAFAANYHNLVCSCYKPYDYWRFGDPAKEPGRWLKGVKPKTPKP